MENPSPVMTGTLRTPGSPWSNTTTVNRPGGLVSKLRVLGPVVALELGYRLGSMSAHVSAGSAGVSGLRSSSTRTFVHGAVEPQPREQHGAPGEYFVLVSWYVISPLTPSSHWKLKPKSALPLKTGLAV